MVLGDLAGAVSYLTFRFYSLCQPTYFAYFTCCRASTRPLRYLYHGNTDCAAANVILLVFRILEAGTDSWRR